MLNSVEFLRLFQHQRYTLAYLSKSGMRSFPVRPEKLENAIKLLSKYNNEGSEIYFMANEGSGELNASRTACHGTKQVIGLSALFLDAELPDGSDPLPAVLDFCRDFFEHPSIIVTTSPNRYHCYWLLEPEELTKKSIVQWKQIQAFLHSKLSADRTMTDIPQLLRIPGFVNNKKGFKIEVAITEKTNLPYKLQTLYTNLSKQFPELKDYKAFEPLKPVLEDTKVTEGERHEELLRRARKLYTIDSMTDEDVRCYIHGFVANHVVGGGVFLPGGAREKELDRILAAAKGYADEEKQKSLAQSIIQHIERTTKNKSSFELDPDFFYQAPGTVGELTRHIVDTSIYQIPSHAFAAAVTIFGLTLAKRIEGPNGLPPLNYFLCLAPSGSGKTGVQKAIKKTLSQVGIAHLLEDGIGSAQGLLKFLSSHTGLGVVMYDESKDLFQASKSQNSYESRIPIELTKLYTAYGTPYSPPTLKTDKRSDKIVLDNPLLSLIGFGQHVLVETAFTKQNVTEGLLSRFIILQANTRLENTDLQTKHVPNHIIDELRNNVVLSGLIEESKIKDSNLPIEDKKIDRVQLPIDPSAQPILDAFKARLTSLYNQAVSDRDGIEALYSRGLEQALRLSLAMSRTSIDLPTLTFATTLLESQIQAFYEMFSKTVLQTQYAKETDRLYEKIIDLCQESSDSTISKRGLQNSTARWFKNGHDFRMQLAELIDRGLVVEFQHTKPSGQRESRLRLGEISNT